MKELNLSSVAKAVQDMGRVVADGKKHGKTNFEFQSLKARNDPYKIAVIDGSNHNVKGMNFLFTTLRAGFEIYQNNELIDRDIDDIIVEFIGNNNDRVVGFASKYEQYYLNIVEDLPDKYPEFEKTPERIRTLLEWNKLKQLIEILDENDIIVFDGALISGTITTNHNFFNGLAQKAKERGITLVGLSKDTSLSIDSAPVPIVLLESSSEFHPNKNWYVEYKPGTYFVRFSKHTDQVFRLDAVKPDQLPILDVMTRISDYCFDPTTFGYPYPMQNIHDSVRIDEMQKQECFEIFKEEYLKAGMPERVFDDMFNIYHDQLDKISWGR